MRFIFFSLYLMMFCFVQGAEKSEVEAFIKTFKTSEGLKKSLSDASVLSSKELSEENYLTRLEKMTQDPNIRDLVRVVADNRQLFLEHFVLMIDLNIISIDFLASPFELSTLKDGRLLLLFDGPKDGFKVPFVLIEKDGKLFVDILTLQFSSMVQVYNEFEDELDRDYVILRILAYTPGLYAKKGLDWSYLDSFTKFYNTKDMRIAQSLVVFAVTFKDILVRSGKVLLEKGDSLSEREKKIRAMQFYFVKEILNDPVIGEIKNAYDIAKKIYDDMSEEEKKTYILSPPKM